MTDAPTPSAPSRVTPLWWRIVRHVLRLNEEKRLGLIAAGVAFYAILAVYPGIAATIALWGIVGDTALALAQMEELSALSTPDGLPLGWASRLSFGFALWSARAGVAALMQGLNAIYDAPNRSGLSHYLRAFVLTFSLIGVMLVAMACIVVLPVVLAYLPLGPWVNLGVDVLRWCVGVAVLVAGFAVIYRLGPNLQGARQRLISPGALFAVVGWLAASTGFSVYLQNFGRYNEIYGSLGAVIVMLMWLFISAYLVLLGGALNAELARARQARGITPE